MIKKRIERISKIILICCLGVLANSCTSDDGIDGRNGVNGVNGANGQGFDELTKYGSVSTTFTGKRPDGVDFTQTNVFKYIYTPRDTHNNRVEKDGNDLYFYVKRSLKVPSPDGNINEVYCWFYIGVIDAGLPTQELSFSNTYNNLGIISPDNKFFILKKDWQYILAWSSEDPYVSNSNITGYSYDDQTKNLKCSFSYMVDATQNDSGHDLMVSVNVDVNVLEELNP